MSGFDIALIWFALCALVAQLVFRFFTRASSRRVEDTTFDFARDSFVGGMWWTRSGSYGSGSAPSPCARLSFLDGGIRLGPSARVLNPFLPTLEIRFAEIESVGYVTGRKFGGPGIRVHAPGLDIDAVFRTDDPVAVQNTVLDIFGAHDVVVDGRPPPADFMMGE